MRAWRRSDRPGPDGPRPDRRVDRRASARRRNQVSGRATAKPAATGRNGADGWTRMVAGRAAL
jgi:hypothetical protein